MQRQKVEQATWPWLSAKTKAQATVLSGCPLDNGVLGVACYTTAFPAELDAHQVDGNARCAVFGSVVFGFHLRERFPFRFELDYFELDQADALQELHRQADTAFVRDVFGCRDRPTGRGEGRPWLSACVEAA